MSDIAEADAEEWSALSHWSILYFSASFIGQVFGNIYTVVPLLVGALQGGILFVVFGGAGLIGIVVLSGVVRHHYFRYKLDDSKVQLHEGFINKKQLALEYHRIQNISIEHPFYFRPLNLVILKVDGAGSSGEEVSLAALTLDEGEAIRQFILAKKTSQVAQQTDSVDEPEGAQLLITRSPLDLVLHGITNNRTWVVAGFVAAAAGQASEQLTTSFASFGIELGTTVQDYAQDLSIYGLIVAIGVLSALVMSVITVISILASLFSYFNYRLNTTESGYLETRGLATHREVNMRKSRVQALAIKQNWLDLIIERMHLVFEQISHMSPEQPLASGNTRIMVPSITFDQSMDLLQDYDAQLPRLCDLEFAPISIRYWRKLALISLPIYALPAIFFSLEVPDLPGLGVVFVLAYMLQISVVFLIYNRWGIAVSGNYVVVRKGIVGIDYIVLPAFKMQRVALHETPLTKRRGLSSISFLVASRSVKVPFIDSQLARDVLNYCAYQVESRKRSWM